MDPEWQAITSLLFAAFDEEEFTDRPLELVRSSSPESREMLDALRHLP